MAVMIGIDPHKGSHTAVAVTAAEEPLRQVRVRACPAQAGQLVAWAAAWPERIWAVEGALGLGRLLAQQLVAAGELVLDVQPKLAARVRLLHTENTGKSDPNDALSVAVAALRSKARRPVIADDHATVLKVWAKRHRDLSRARNQAACRLHAVLCDLVPGGVADEITAGRAARILGQIRPAGPAAEAHRELAGELLVDIRHLDAQRREVTKKLATAVKASGTSLTEVFGVGPVIAATVIGDVVAVARFGTRDRFAACNGTAPGRGVLRREEDLPAVAARQPQARPRHPHGRDHPDLACPQRRPRLLPAEARRRQDPQGSPPVPEAAHQRRHLRPPARRRPHEGPGRATGEPLCLQGGRAHTPHTGSSGKPLPGPRPAYDPRPDTRCPCRRPSISEESPASHLTTTKAKRIRSARQVVLRPDFVRSDRTGRSARLQASEPADRRPTLP
jgi:transposase